MVVKEMINIYEGLKFMLGLSYENMNDDSFVNNEYKRFYWNVKEWNLIMNEHQLSWWIYMQSLSD